MSAISVLAKRKALWYLGLVLGVIGTGLFVKGLL